MRDEESGGDIWSNLKTVSTFDDGDNENNDSGGGGAMAMAMKRRKEFGRFSPSSLLVESLIEQLCKMMENDPTHQKTLYLMICDKLHRMKLIDTSYHMDEFEFMRSHYQRALYNLLTVAKAAKSNRDMSGGSSGNSPSATAANVFYPKVPSLKLDLELTPEKVLEWSRYANEFVELEFIARGGFGQVYKARHKLDGTVYAVKKIHLRYQNANGFLRSLKEVKMLACLNHPNIVAYKAAWLEPFDSRSTKHGQVTTVIVDDDNSDSSSDDNKKTDDSSDIVTFQKSKSKSKSSDYCRNDCSSRGRKSNNDSRSVLVSGSSTDSSSVGGVFGTDVDFGGGSNLAVCKFRHSVGRVHAWNFMQDSFKQDWATLFVQMQLCEENMRQWLDRRNRRTSSLTLSVTDMEQCLSLFVKILRGIEYIHDKGIVHHDIKPSNIFVSEDLNQVQVGDFGLACCLLTHSKVPFVPSNQSPEHKGRIGTKLYAAPEQVNGVCSPKSDIYSVGIILLELIRPFQTEMERSKVISQLKRGHVSPELTAKWPDLVRVITQTVCSSPNKRPTARDLLKTISTKQKAAAMSGILCEKDELIRQLKEELATKNKEIVALKQKLASLGID